MTNDKNSFILYTNYYEILDNLQDSDMGALFRAILKYQATGELPSLPANLEIAFKFIKNQFDLDEKKYNEFIERQSANGKKGGRPKIEKETQENPKNPTLFSETQKTLNENENENENDNVNENENVSLSDEREGVIGGERGIGVNRGVNRGENYGVAHEYNSEMTNGIAHSSNSEPNNCVISERDKKILEDYVRRKKLATKDVRAYVNKIISNGNHFEILKEERERGVGVNIRGAVNKDSPPAETREERIKRELSSIHDKKSAAKVLAVYHDALEEYPPELEPIALQYGLSTSSELEEYVNELRLAKMQAARGP